MYHLWRKTANRKVAITCDTLEASIVLSPQKSTCFSDFLVACLMGHLPVAKPLIAKKPKMFILVVIPLTFFRSPNQVSEPYYLTSMAMAAQV